MKRKHSEKSTARAQEVGARVRYIRENLGYSLAYVCRRLDQPEPSRQTLQRWETGEIAIGIDRLEQLARIFEINPGDLLGY
jgi:transcriptional regulator with XRE-family HTH domain